jgi:TetR/AcrR family transcriptional repressor of nem operon
MVLFSEMVGALLLSRAVAAAAPVLSDEILEAGRKHLRAAAKARRQGSVQSR